ncbi:PP2C family protein-serine/threonine phosphatase [Aquibacillus rhizosphaerae]|uniref:Protein phosphatase 2C domain-containing protein n=1 Tax=Aquibacillus rhizosphaerae TaxID=3051431 RepID=A0ABT7KZP0_9BACI|nr:protein phosphatase 2C domain-containing protein [Aquibacillus sp. LR5S19]MDL4838922.1 protein phosphatase 2C domain-containing protein [Aquibacillus sp. LR5S19]
MDFITTYHTSTGVNKNTNQDALMIKTANTKKGKIGLFVVCDGMGGLAQGELASATVIRGMSDWFEQDLPEIMDADEVEDELERKLEDHVRFLNQKIISYGKEAQAKLGTTITALLLLELEYYVVQIGDSRAYAIGDNIQQITKDQSLVAREVARGTITVEQARHHPKRHVLLQCIGAVDTIDVVITKGQVKRGTSFLLCTDGFYHEVTEEEIIRIIKPDVYSNNRLMKEHVTQLVDLAKQRDELDDISVILTKVV